MKNEDTVKSSQQPSEPMNFGSREKTALEVINDKLGLLGKLSEESARLHGDLQSLRDCLPTALPNGANRLLRDMVNRICP